MSNSFAIPWTVACQAPLSMEFPRQEYWSGLPFPSPGDLPNPGIKPVSPELTDGFFPTEPPGKSKILDFVANQWGFSFHHLVTLECTAWARLGSMCRKDATRRQYSECRCFKQFLKYGCGPLFQ